MHKQFGSQHKRYLKQGKMLCFFCFLFNEVFLPSTPCNYGICLIEHGGVPVPFETHKVRRVSKMKAGISRECGAET